MHTVGRSSGNQPIGRLFCQTVFDQANCWFDKKMTGIWKKEIRSNPTCNMINQPPLCLWLCRMVQALSRFPNRKRKNLDVRVSLVLKRVVNRSSNWLLYGNHINRPASFCKLIGKEPPTLHSRATCRWPIVAYEYDMFVLRTAQCIMVLISSSLAAQKKGVTVKQRCHIQPTESACPDQ